jgi:hypothetical protein
MRPLDPAGSAGTTTVPFAGDTAALTGLAALETVADLEVFLTEGKAQFYLAREHAVSGSGPKGKNLAAD